MSYTALILFKDGKPDSEVEFRNAWGGAARIWDALFKAYVPKKHQCDSWICNPEDRRLWDLAKRQDLPLSERAVHAWTFDLHYVRNKHFGRMANDLRSFVSKFPVENRIDHLPAWASWLDLNRHIEAVGIYGTSVAENPWYRNKTCQHCGQETDEPEGIPLCEGSEVYDWLDTQK